MKENELAPEQAVKPVVASNATDGLGQMELPITEGMHDADTVTAETSDACVGSGSVDSQAQRLDFWSTSRDSGPTATVSYRRRRRYTAPDASAEAVAPGVSMEATDSETLTESDTPKATTEAVAEAPVEVLARDEPTDTSARDEFVEVAAPVAPRYAPAAEAAPEETRAPKPGRNSKILAEAAGAEVMTREAQIRKRGPKQITLPGVDASPEARTQKTQTRKSGQKETAPIATQSPSRSSLLAQLASVNAQLERLRATEVPKVVEEIQQLMQEYGLRIEDIAGKPSVGRAAHAAPTNTKAAAPPKYRNPKTGQTWSGRGRAPAWIGKKPKRFLIDRSY